MSEKQAESKLKNESNRGKQLRGVGRGRIKNKCLQKITNEKSIVPQESGCDSINIAKHENIKKDQQENKAKHLCTTNSSDQLCNPLENVAFMITENKEIGIA